MKTLQNENSHNALGSILSMMIHRLLGASITVPEIALWVIFVASCSGTVWAADGWLRLCSFLGLMATIIPISAMCLVHLLGWIYRKYGA